MMNAVRKKKLCIVVSLMVILGLSLSLVLYALRQNISLFYTPTQVALNEAPYGVFIRIGGMVERKSVIHAKEDLAVEFRLTDNHQSVVVRYKGILPDLFREGQGIVTKGRLVDNHTFDAIEVFAKHDANYMPPELKGTIYKKQVQ